MSEHVGRARPYLIIAPILAFVLLVVAIVVAIGGPDAFDATPTASARRTIAPSPAMSTRASGSPTAEPDAARRRPCADDVMAREAAYMGAISRVTTVRVDAGQLVLTGPDIDLRYAELSGVLPGG